MTDKNVWFVTGAGRGMGVDIVKAALAAGHVVVATGRNPDAVIKALGEAADLLVVKLDITRVDDAKAAVAAAIERFGRIDVLVNNAGNFYAGFFEELSPEDFRAQIETNLFGPVNVTRAVLPVMRAHRRGLIVTISSTGGISGQAFVSAYSAALHINRRNPIGLCAGGWVYVQASTSHSLTYFCFLRHSCQRLMLSMVGPRLSNDPGA